MVESVGDILFADLCNFCDTAVSAGNRKEKLRLISNFAEFLLAKLGPAGPSGSLFPVLRLILPQLDRSREAYRIKETTLANLYIQIMCLPKSGADAQRLLPYRTSKVPRGMQIEFADVLYNVIRRRCSGASTLTLSDVNAALDRLSDMNGKNKREDIKSLLKFLIAQMSAVEQKWLVRIILKKVKLGVDQNTILRKFHPQAKELNDATNDLEKVCSSLADPNLRPSQAEISLFTPCRPMLADRAVIGKIPTQIGHPGMYVETKLDGERTQIHKEGKRYSYFSRGGFDYSDKFGRDPSSGTLTPSIDECFNENVENCILDGEMVVWNTENNFIVNKALNVDAKNLRPGATLKPCFFAFDILLLNGQILTNLPLKQRLGKLESAVRIETGVVDYPVRTLVDSKDRVIALLNKAIDDREEGVVLKDPNSTYKPNVRNGGWLKVKPEYVDSLMDHLDLIILGGYYGEGRRRGLITQFLLGVASDSDAKQFLSFVRLGSGYSQKELLELLTKLSPNWKQFDRKTAGQTCDSIKLSREKPDLWIEPSSSFIVQVKASEIVPSDSYKVGFTLRFPRVEKIRYDLRWNQAMTLKEVIELKERGCGKLATRHYIQDDYEPPAKRALRKRVTHDVAQPFIPARLSQVVAVCDCFRQLEMCVISGDAQASKQQIEQQIVAGMGAIVQNPGATTFCIVAGKEDLRFSNIKKQKKWDVVRPSWIANCLDANSLVSFSPRDLLYYTEETERQLNSRYDEFGNHLYTPTPLQDVACILQCVRQKVNPQPLTHGQMADVDFDIFTSPFKYGIFRSSTVYVDQWRDISNPDSGVLCGLLEIMALDLRLYGACVVSALTKDTSHVVCDARDDKRVFLWKRKNEERFRKFHLVSADWVSDSVALGRMLSEFDYMPD